MPDAPELVIFDCDGVLIDSEPIGCRVEAEVLTRAGFPITADEILERYTGVSFSETMQAIESAFGRPLPAGFEEQVQAEIAAAFDRELQPIAGVDAALEAIDRPICVASSSRLARLRHTLRLTALLDRFGPHLYSAEQVGDRGKPAPDLFLYAAAQMGVRPADCVVVEDSLNGVRAGVAAGMRVVGFTGGGHCRAGHGDRLREVGATTVIAAMDELLPLVAG